MMRGDRGTNLSELKPEQATRRRRTEGAACDGRTLKPPAMSRRESEGIGGRGDWGVGGKGGIGATAGENVLGRICLRHGRRNGHFCSADSLGRNRLC